MNHRKWRTQCKFYLHALTVTFTFKSTGHVELKTELIIYVISRLHLLAVSHSVSPLLSNTVRSRSACNENKSRSDCCRGWRCDNNMAVTKQQLLIKNIKWPKGRSAITIQSRRLSDHSDSRCSQNNLNKVNHGH